MSSLALGTPHASRLTPHASRLTPPIRSQRNDEAQLAAVRGAGRRSRRGGEAHREAHRWRRRRRARCERLPSAHCERLPSAPVVRGGRQGELNPRRAGKQGRPPSEPALRRQPRATAEPAVRQQPRQQPCRHVAAAAAAWPRQQPQPPQPEPPRPRRAPRCAAVGRAAFRLPLGEGRTHRPM